MTEDMNVTVEAPEAKLAGENPFRINYSGSLTPEAMDSPYTRFLADAAHAYTNNLDAAFPDNLSPHDAENLKALDTLLHDDRRNTREGRIALKEALGALEAENPAIYFGGVSGHLEQQIQSLYAAGNNYDAATKTVQEINETFPNFGVVNEVQTLRELQKPLPTLDPTNPEAFQNAVGDLSQMIDALDHASGHLPPEVHQEQLQNFARTLSTLTASLDTDQKRQLLEQVRTKMKDSSKGFDMLKSSFMDNQAKEAEIAKARRPTKISESVRQELGQQAGLKKREIDGSSNFDLFSESEPEPYNPAPETISLLEVMSNTSPELSIPPEVGQQYRGHGIARGATPTENFTQLCALLEHGIRTDKPFYSASLIPFEGVVIDGADRPYDQGGIIVLAKPGGDFDTGIDSVLLGPEWYHAIPTLKDAYPNMNFIKAGEAKKILTAKLQNS